MPAARLADLVAAAIEVVAPRHGRDPRAIADHAIAAAGRREGLRGAHDGGRVDPRARHRRRCTPSCRRSIRGTTWSRRIGDAAAAPVGAYRSDGVAPLSPRRSARSSRERARRRSGRTREGPCHRRRRASSAAGSSPSCSRAATRSCRRQPVAGDAANLAEFVGHPGLAPLEVGDVRDAAACRRWLVAVDAVAHLAASISVQDSHRRSGHDVRQRRRRHVQPARGGPGQRGPLPVHEHLHGVRPGRRAAGHRRGPPDEAGLAVRGVEAVGRGAHALVRPRLRPPDDRRPAVQHVRAVPALGRRGWGRRDLHPSLAARRAAPDLRGWDPDAGPPVRGRLRPVRLRRAALRRGGRTDPQCRHGRDVSVNALAAADRARPGRIVHVEHIHPQSEIPVLRCDPRLAAELLGWRPEVDLAEGLAGTRAWMAEPSDRRGRRSRDARRGRGAA